MGYSEVSINSRNGLEEDLIIRTGGEPVMKQEPGLKAPGTFDFEDLRHLPPE
jgi:hypothetical protein